MSTKRRVMVSHSIRNPKTKIMELRDKGVAVFHEFGLENDDGSGSYSVAIVEWPSGKLKRLMQSAFDFQIVRCRINKLDKFDEIFESLEVWLEKHYGTAEVLAIVIGCSAALLLLEYQNGMMS